MIRNYTHKLMASYNDGAIVEQLTATCSPKSAKAQLARWTRETAKNCPSLVQAPGPNDETVVFYVRGTGTQFAAWIELI
jgi:hypothetical protein